MCLHEDGRFSKYKNQLRQIFKGKSKRIYLFLFTDLLLVTKMKGEEQFKVIDYCQRSLLKTEVLTHIPDPEPPKYGTLGTLNINPLRYAFTLVLLENSNGKTVDYHCFLPTEWVSWLFYFFEYHLGVDSKASQTSNIEKVLTIFVKKLHLRCSTGFWIRHCHWRWSSYLFLESLE